MSEFKFHLMAVKNGVVYPVMLTREQVEMMPMVTSLLGKLTVLNKPQGLAETLEYSVPKNSEPDESA